MSPAELEQTLRDLTKTGKRIKAYAYREVWRFEFAGKPYYLKFYPRMRSPFKRLIRGNPALREFTSLQTLQRAKIPAPRAVAHLSGFSLDERKGDAVILEGIEPSIQLDQYLSDKVLRGEPVPEHRQLVRQVIDIVRQLGQAKLGHVDLHLGNFLLHEGKLFLLDAYAVRAGGMKTKDILRLGHSVQRFATRTDVFRGWWTFADGQLPRKNSVRRRQWRKFDEAAHGDNRYFGTLKSGAWSGRFFRFFKFPKRWAPASRLEVTRDDCKLEFERLLKLIDADQLEILKRSLSGDVLAGEIALNGRPVSVIIKRTRRRKWYRYFNEILRGSRAARAWRKSWWLIARDIPTAWPLLMMERRVFGYVVDSFIVFERIRAEQLYDFNLDALDPRDRQTLFRRLGQTLRALQNAGLRQNDAKSTNWMIVEDPKLGPLPVIVDVDGIRRWASPLAQVERLLRSMRDHKQYTPADSKELCLGYAPWARLVCEDQPQESEATP